MTSSNPIYECGYITTYYRGVREGLRRGLVCTHEGKELRQIEIEELRDQIDNSIEQSDERVNDVFSPVVDNSDDQSSSKTNL